ncbi:MerR family transcriptional regulator [Leuconostoc citreum]|uniref:MerR family transcriptional regulator n=1 Tax=Leuconostoc citreum TaxID=33964 RepID=UPI000BFEE989|nr:MerR family transcriptional regulator [Leuconostoc citreum]
MSESLYYSIGQFSKMTDLSIDTLRYYEKEKLIYPTRNSSNQRCYTTKDLAWINFIIKLKKTGMDIKHIREYAQLRYQGNSTIPQRLKLLFEQLDNLHQQESHLENNITFIEDKIKTYLQITNML